MKDLQDLVQIVTKPKIRTLQLFGQDAKSGPSKLSEFYCLLSNGELRSDEEAAQHFYNQDKSFPAYQKLRKTFKDRLVNALFLIDLKKPSYNVRQKAYYECYREWAAAKILFGKQATYTALSLCQKLLKLARKFEFTEMVVDIAHTMRLYYGTIEGDYKKYLKYNELFKEYERLWMLENRSEEYYTQLSIGFINSKAVKVDIQNIAKSYAEELSGYLDEFDSYQLHLCTRLVQVGVYTLLGDKEQAIKVCDSAIQFFDQKSYVARIPLQIFYYKKIICYFQLRQFKLALDTAKKCEQYLETNSFNWFKLQELYLLCHFHIQDFAAAKTQIDLIAGNASFDQLPENIQEFWRIAEAYLLIIEYSNEADETKIHQLFEILDRLEVFPKDKEGMNIPIQVLKFLGHLLVKDYDPLIDGMDAINQYRKRYLLKEEHMRSNLFIKLLLYIPRKGFQIDKIDDASKETHEKLMNTSFELTNQSHQLEIIPYEELWKIALKLL